MALRALSALVAGALLAGGCQPSLLDYEARVHVVRPGETLYTIAWNHGLDYRDLARWNGLSDPDFIRVGQQLALRPAATMRSSAPASAPASGNGGAVPRAASMPPPRPLPAPPDLPAPEWTWPTAGAVVARFGSGDGIPSGIAIAGRQGQDIVAAADGQVVYVGTGLANYGQLVIIRHNETYLSAYGHTERLRVTQGQAVARGQVIGSMGVGPRREPRLHFEIRRNGAPVDPLTLVSAP
jgi:lipoprotein NlpD